VAGFGDAPLARTPLQASSIGKEAGRRRHQPDFGPHPKLDASVSDAYNADGYWSSLTMRGYTLDNRFNYRRDGLPINAETAIALENKERLEVFKGTSGIQAGTSAPGGLVDLIVKRPNGKPRNVRWKRAKAAACWPRWTSASALAPKAPLACASTPRTNGSTPWCATRAANARLGALALTGN
jgi:iron complex outermembrane receptor protein